MAAILTDLFDRTTASSQEPVKFIDANTVLEETAWAEIYKGAVQRAAGLQQKGIESGDRVAILALTSRETVETIFAVLLAGAAIVILPLPFRLSSKEAFVENTRARLTTSQAKLLLLDDFFAAQYKPVETDAPHDLLSNLKEKADDFTPVTILSSDLAILQFTSGSTAAPRAVRLQHGAVVANMFGISSALALRPSDRLVTWLPLYHDMGLIGTLFSAAAIGAATVATSPQSFIGRPAMWMEAVHTHKATVTVGPNFSYGLATRGLRRAKDLDLSSLRLAICGAEPIDADNIAAWVEAARPFGLDPTIPLCVYGLAENTVGATVPKLGQGLRFDTVDRHTLETKNVAIPTTPDTDPRATKKIVGLGQPIRGVALRIVDVEDGHDLEERQVGEVLVAGQSLMQGYDRAPEKTAAVVRNGWAHTGDLGYILDGELFLCGRKKDMIIIGGRNIWPEDIEAAIQSTEGIRKGNVIAFGKERDKGREALVVVAESKLSGEEAKACAAAAAEKIREQVGLAPRHLILIKPSELPKTSSGKSQRSLCREMYNEKKFEIVGEAGHLF